MWVNCFVKSKLTFIISHLSWLKTKNPWDPLAQTATWCDFCSTSTSLGWTTAPWSLSRTTTGSSAQQWRTTSLWQCAWKLPSATEPSSSRTWKRHTHVSVKPDPHTKKTGLFNNAKFTAILLFIYSQKINRNLYKCFKASSLCQNKFCMGQHSGAVVLGSISGWGFPVCPASSHCPA